jgi:hypothetical protein
VSGDRRAREILKKRLETARRFAGPTSTKISAAGPLALREDVSNGTRGVWNDLGNEATRTLLRITERLHQELTAEGVIVTATGPNGIRRALACVELRKVSIEIANNTIVTNDLQWRDVEITLPVLAKANIAAPAKQHLIGASSRAEPTTRDDAKLPIEKPPSLQARLASWLRGAGSRHRNRPNREIRAAFKTDTGLSVGDEIIRLARNDCGLPNRPTRAQRRPAH